MQVDLCTIDTAVLSRLADGQPRRKSHQLIVRRELSADHRKLALLMPAVMYATIADKVFPFLRTLGGDFAIASPVVQPQDR
jgi:hypothetical protein